MSIIRFGEEDSDVYVYESSQGMECAGCSLLSSAEEGFRAPSRSRVEMFRHLELHRLAGDKVPEIAFERLVGDGTTIRTNQ